MKTLYRKYKILLIALTCAVTGIIAFFTIHGVVYNIVSSKNTQNTNEKLEDKIFVFYHDNQIRVANIKENGTYIQKRYQKSDDGIAKLIATDGKKMLNYSFTYWGNIVSINSGPLQYDNNGNIIKFGADGYTLATEEELSIIQAAEERESTKCKLSDFMMTPDEYRAVYKASGMPISNNLIDLDSKDFCILYEKKDYNKKTLESILITDNGIPDKNTVRLISDSLNGKTRGYDYMMRPILLYLKNIPGALADIHEIIDRWDAVEEKPNFAGEIISIFTHNGITNYKMESSTDSRMYIEISVHKNHEIYLAD